MTDRVLEHFMTRAWISAFGFFQVISVCTTGTFLRTLLKEKWNPSEMASQSAPIKICVWIVDYRAKKFLNIYRKAIVSAAFLRCVSNVMATDPVTGKWMQQCPPFPYHGLLWFIHLVLHPNNQGSTSNQSRARHQIWHCAKIASGLGKKH
jgi:hypothetical protein